MIHFLEAHWRAIAAIYVIAIFWFIYECRNPQYVDAGYRPITPPKPWPRSNQEVIHQCSWCKKWMHNGKLHDSQPVEASTISHGICPPCAVRLLESVNTTP